MMTLFIENLNKYIEHYGIKQSFIVKRTEIEKNKLSRILKGKQDVLLEDMNLIAKVLGKEVSFFMQADLELPSLEYKETAEIAFYMGTPDESKIQLANLLFDFLEHIDAILGVRKRIEKDCLEVSDYEI